MGMGTFVWTHVVFTHTCELFLIVEQKHMILLSSLFVHLLLPWLALHCLHAYLTLQQVLHTPTSAAGR
jgi:hypothetical protein